MKTVAYIRSTNIYDDSRATKEIYALETAGYLVLLIGWNRNESAKDKCEELFKGKNIKCYFYEGKAESGIGLKNIGKLIGWFKWVHRVINNHREIDVVHACNLDSAIGLVGTKMRNKAVVYDIYDYYADSHNIPRALLPIVEKTENTVVNKADATIICTEERFEQINKTKPNKLVVIHNSPDVDIIPESEVEYDYAYCGSLCERRLLKEILGEYKNHDNIKMVFAGNDVFYNDAKILGEKFDNFKFEGTIPYARVIELETKARVLSAIYEPSIRNHRLCAPNKFYEALALAKPIIVCRGTGIDKVVEKYNIGKVIDYDVEQFYTAVLYFKNNEAICQEMGKRARILYEDNYRWSMMKKRLMKLYKELG